MMKHHTPCLFIINHCFLLEKMWETYSQCLGGKDAAGHRFQCELFSYRSATEETTWDWNAPTLTGWLVLRWCSRYPGIGWLLLCRQNCRRLTWMCVSQTGGGTTSTYHLLANQSQSIFSSSLPPHSLVASYLVSVNTELWYILQYININKPANTQIPSCQICCSTNETYIKSEELT